MQDFFDQVIQDVAVAAGEGGDKARNVAAAPHGRRHLRRVRSKRNRRQLQPGDPAFGANFERGEVVGRQSQPHHLIEKRRGFFGRKAQVGRADFDQLITGAQPCERPGWIGSAGDDDVQVRRQVLKQINQRVMDRA